MAHYSSIITASHSPMSSQDVRSRFRMAMFSSARSLLSQRKVHASGAARPFWIAFYTGMARGKALSQSLPSQKKDIFDTQTTRYSRVCWTCMSVHQPVYENALGALAPERVRWKQIVKNHQDAALWVIWLRATTTKNQGKQLSAHHSKYNVLHLDIMKQAFCHKNWTVPNCHVTEIDFSKTWKQASKQAKSNTFKWWTGSFWFSAATRIEGYMQTGYSRWHSFETNNLETRLVSAGKDEFPLWSGKFLPDTLCGCILTTHNGSCSRVGSRESWFQRSR